MKFYPTNVIDSQRLGSYDFDDENDNIGLQTHADEKSAPKREESALTVFYKDNSVLRKFVFADVTFVLTKVGFKQKLYEKNAEISGFKLRYEPQGTGSPFTTVVEYSRNPDQIIMRQLGNGTDDKPVDLEYVIKHLHSLEYFKLLSTKIN